MKEMSLPEPASTINEKRIELLPGVLSNRACAGMREPVALPHDEIFEREFVAELFFRNGNYRARFDARGGRCRFRLRFGKQFDLDSFTQFVRKRLFNPVLKIFLYP